MSQASDRNLLFGILAVQMDFCGREALFSAMTDWAQNKSASLGDILVRRQAIPVETQALLDALVLKHLAMHGNEAEKSLASISSATSLRQQLLKIADADVQASLVHVGAAAPPEAKTGGEIDPGAATAHKEPGAAVPKTPTVGTTTAAGVRYRVLRPHAKGGLGAVFVAEDQELHREVALKEIQERHADNLENRSRFVLEAEITGGLEHPGIVPIYGLGTYADGRPYYAMRFIRGDSLKDAIKHFHRKDGVKVSPNERTLELRNLLGRFVDVCNAIAYAHSRGILHRDLKPGNIMLGKYGETLVVDWGLAKPVGQTGQNVEVGEKTLVPNSLSSSSQTLMGSAIGTPQYMSPEQAAGQLDTLGPASDVYSLGATLYCVLTGKAPFGGSGVETVLYKVSTGEFPHPRKLDAKISPPLEAVCLKAMALKPADRYASPRDLAADIEKWLADEPVSAWPEPLTVKARRWIGRHRTLVTSLASVVVVAVVGLSVAAVLLNEANRRERSARAEAEHNFKLARQAVDHYYTEVSEEDLLNQPGMDQLRKRLLESAREYYERFVAEHAADPTLRAEFGKALFRLALITGAVGSETEAVALHEKAVQEYQTLAPEQTTPEMEVELARTFDDLGRLYRKTDQRSKAEEALKQALSLWERLIAQEGATETYRAGLAQSRLRMGNWFNLERDLDSAQKYFEQALDSWSALVAANPKEPRYRRYEATSYNNLAQVVGNAREAQQYYLKAEKSLKKLVEDYPWVAQYKSDLARTCWSLGVFYAERKTLGEPEPYLKQAAHLWEALVERHPAHQEYHVLLADCYVSFASLYGREKKADLAEDYCKKALSEMQRAGENKDAPDYQESLARVYRNLGDVERGRGVVDKAAAAYETGRKIVDNLLSKQPDIQRFRGESARNHNSVGLLLEKQKKNGDAAAEFGKAQKLWDRLFREHPANQEYVADLAIVYRNLARVAFIAKKPEDSLSWCTRGIDELDAKGEGAKRTRAKGQIAQLYKTRADVLRNRNRMNESLPDWDRVMVLSPSGSLAYGAAQAYSLAAAGEKNKDAAEKYAVRAVQLLDAAQALDYFKTPANVKRLRTDPDLQFLRERADFNKLLSELR